VPDPALAPEVELLLCCARSRPEAAAAGRIRALVQGGIDWEHLLELAHRHGTLPLLYWNLNAICPDAVPAATLARLRAFFQANAQRNLYLTGELVEILRLLEEHGLVAVPFKGPVLAASVYGNLALRRFADLDLLVQERDVARAAELLVSQGYRFCAEGARPSYLCEHKLSHDGKGVAVDLHWRVTGRHIPFHLELERLWARLEPISLAGAPLHTLPPEELLLVLCVHGCKHDPIPWEDLIWICDVAELIAARPGLDWGRVTEEARRLGARRMLFIGLVLACDLLGAALPGAVLEQGAADPVPPALAARVRTYLFDTGSASSRIAGRYAFHLKMRERWRDRLPYVLLLGRIVRPGALDREWAPLPGVLSFLHYPLRLLRLVREYGLRESVAVLRGKEI
jgi:hypothetical protein